MAKTKKVLELKIVFDTNVIYTGSSSDFFKNEISEIIKNYTTTNDLKISWYVPEIVVTERRFQMRKKGLELLPSLNKLERIIGHNLAITKEIIETRINETISKKIEEYALNIITLDLAKVEWDKIIYNACNRIPPFEDNEKEKGFRDSLVLECIMQLIDKSPSSNSICRIIFATGDKLLQEAFFKKTTDLTNVKIFESLEEVESLINVLASQITEELINSLIKTAEDLFHFVDNKETFFFKEKLGEKIYDTFRQEVNALPVGADRRENYLWTIPKPGFVKKTNQKIYWKTIITLRARAFRKKQEAITKLTDNLGNPFETQAGSLSSNIFSNISQSKNQSYEEIMSEGKSRFEIFWSSTLTTTKKLTKLKLEEINFIDTVWE